MTEFEFDREYASIMASNLADWAKWIALDLLKEEYDGNLYTSKDGA